MKPLFFSFLLLLFFSCQKDNSYYYLNNQRIKDSVVIKFINSELEKIKISTKEKNGLKIYTTLDSVSYKNNFDSIKTKLFEFSTKNKFIDSDRKNFDKWLREKVFIINNHSGKITNYYNTYQIKNDRDQIYLYGLRKLIKTGGFLINNPKSNVNQDVLYSSYGSVNLKQKDLEISDSELKFLQKLKINDLKNKSYFKDYVYYTDISKIIQTINRNGTFIEPTCIKKIEKESKIIYQNKYYLENIISKNINDKLQKLLNNNLENRLENLPKINHSEEITSILFLGTSSSSFVLIEDKTNTYIIVIEGAIPNKDMKFKVIPYDILKRTSIKYFNAIKN